MLTKKIEVSFPGGKRVDAQIEHMTVPTDQPVANGGTGTAPEPFQLFLASIATCAGIYALEFCRTRKIRTEGMSLSLDYVMDEKNQVCTKLNIDLKLPEDFPKEYHKAVVRVMDLCSVKKSILKPPEFIITAG